MSARSVRPRRTATGCTAELLRGVRGKGEGVFVEVGGPEGAGLRVPMPSAVGFAAGANADVGALVDGVHRGLGDVAAFDKVVPAVGEVGVVAGAGLEEFDLIRK